MKRQPVLFIVLAWLFSLLVLAQALGNLSGTVKDPKGAVVVGAQVSVRHETTNETKTATTDAQGRFSVTGLAPGNYVVTITRDGFKPSEQKVVIDDKRTTTTEIKLDIAEVRGEVTTSAVGTIKPNTDPNYRALRDGKLGETYSVTNLTLKRDVGTFILKSGRISFLPPVLNRVAVGVFVGEGEFTLEPVFWIEREHLKTVTEKETFAEPFTRLVLYFSDNTYDEIKKQGQVAGAADSALLDALKDIQDRMRDRERGSGENIEAEILTDLYNPQRAPSFNVFIDGRKHHQLAFMVRPYGAVDCEEVLFVNADWQAKDAGFLHASHLESELKSGRASSTEDKRVVDAEHYKIENAIKGDKLTANAECTLTALTDGERMLGLGLLPDLRVTRVLWNEKETDFIQEDKKKDGSFYVILPEAMTKGRKYKLTVEYQGEKVLRDAGGGNFAIGARTSWYPNVNTFKDRATFDLTFKVPKQFTLVSVGKKMKEWQDGDFAASQWVSETPLAVAGFNYGKFKMQELTDEVTKYKVEGYAVSEMPDGLRNTGIGGMAPTRLIGQSLIEAQNSMRVFTHFFGPLPYGRVAITQQPQANFGQSWPTLVYMPLLAYMDATQRWMLLGSINSSLSEFVDEVNAHEVSHQWWGHIVGWSSYHDQWLSEGFAFFSAGLYLKATEQKPDKYLNYWRHAQEAITKKNEFGLRATDVAPVWMGYRGSFHKFPGAYQVTAYRKGGFVLHMLRQMMWDAQTGDKAFIAMMQDFVKTYYNQNAATEDFKAMAEKHMTAKMDLAGNKKLDWFFLQWVYGKEIPRYKLEYSLTPQEGGKTQLTFTLTQSEVSPGFGMRVPIYLDYDGKMMRLGDVPMVGNSTSQEVKVMLDQKPKRVLLNYNYDVLASASDSVEKK
jgi:hypothetical protein